MCAHYCRVVARRESDAGLGADLRTRFSHKREREENPRPKGVFGEDLKIFQIPDKFYGPPRGGFTSGYERSSEPMLTRTKDIYYPEYVLARVYNPPHRSAVRARV